MAGIYGSSVLNEKVSKVFTYGPFFEILNPKNWNSSPVTNGQFEKIRDRIYKKINWCKSKDDIKYLLNDARTGKNQLIKLKHNLEEALKNPNDKRSLYEEMRKRNKKGLTVKSIEEHIKWIDEVYIPAIKEKSKELN